MAEAISARPYKLDDGRITYRRPPRLTPSVDLEFMLHDGHIASTNAEEALRREYYAGRLLQGFLGLDTQSPAPAIHQAQVSATLERGMNPETVESIAIEVFSGPKEVPLKD